MDIVPLIKHMSFTDRKEQIMWKLYIQIDAEGYIIDYHYYKSSLGEDWIEVYPDIPVTETIFASRYKIGSNCFDVDMEKWEAMKVKNQEVSQYGE